MIDLFKRFPDCFEEKTLKIENYLVPADAERVLSLLPDEPFWVSRFSLNCPEALLVSGISAGGVEIAVARSAQVGGGFGQILGRRFIPIGQTFELTVKGVTESHVTLILEGLALKPSIRVQVLERSVLSALEALLGEQP